MKKGKLFLNIYQAVCIMFLIIFLIGLFCLPEGYVINIFGVLTAGKAFLIFIWGETLFLVLLAIVHKNAWVLMWLVPAIPVSLFILFLGVFWDNTTSYRIEIENYKRTLQIESSSFIFSGKSTIYEFRNPFVMKEITSLSGDDGHRPLKDRDSFEVVYFQNGFGFKYKTGKLEPKAHYYFIYRNNTIESCSLEELIEY